MDGFITDTLVPDAKARPRHRTDAIGVMVADYHYTHTFRVRVGRRHYHVGYSSDSIVNGRVKEGSQPISITPCDPETPSKKIRIAPTEVALIRAHLKKYPKPKRR